MHRLVRLPAAYRQYPVPRMQGIRGADGRGPKSRLRMSRRPHPEKAGLSFGGNRRARPVPGAAFRWSATAA